MPGIYLVYLVYRAGSETSVKYFMANGHWQDGPTGERVDDYVDYWLPLPPAPGEVE